MGSGSSTMGSQVSSAENKTSYPNTHSFDRFPASANGRPSHGSSATPSSATTSLSEILPESTNKQQQGPSSAPAAKSTMRENNKPAGEEVGPTFTNIPSNSIDIPVPASEGGGKRQNPNVTALEKRAIEEGEWTKDVARKFESKGYSQYMDPCQEAADRSLSCLKRNAGDRDMCLAYFKAYRECKKVWLEERRKARKDKGGWW